ncbi:MAG: glycosyltransferase family 4 protein [Rhodospirillales bacterium]
MGAAVGFVLKGYPRLSETFIAQEILTLERLGLDIRLVSLRHPTDPAVHPIHREVRAPIDYLPEYLYQEPARVSAAWRAVRRLPGYAAARGAWLRDLARDRTANRVRRFGQALVLARDLPADVGWLHAHFLHTPASVTRYAAMIRGLPWSVSAHAKDIWTTPDWEKREKLADCRWAVACTRAGVDHLAALAPDPARVDLVYHGLDFDRFPPPPALRPRRDGADETDPVRLLSVGRAVEKKGFEVLIDALLRLRDAIHWRLVHIGGGPSLAALQAKAAHGGIGSRITWMGPQPQETVLEAYRAADVFVLASRIAADGDRDGLPNVLMEAQSQGLACLSTRLPAIGELIVDGETGLLVPSGEPEALAVALERLIRSPALRARLGVAGSRRVRSQFSHLTNVEGLAARFAVASGRTMSCASPSTRR